MTKHFILCSGLALIAFVLAPSSFAQIEIIPGSSAHGAELFREQGCVDCHAFNGIGANAAPDLGRAGERMRTPMQLASVLWNHGPRMWRAQDARQIRPTLNSSGTADLFAYFYSLSYFSAPGNPGRGAGLFATKGCADCHEASASTVMQSRRRLAGLPVFTWEGRGRSTRVG
jgi:cytochrome c551/c552